MFIDSIKVGWFLAYREIKRSSKLSTLLIIFVMCLTFLNLMVGRGVLIGLPEGSERAFKENYVGDVLIKKLDDRENILRERLVMETLQKDPSVSETTTRYLIRANVNADYKNSLSSDEKEDSIFVELSGIDPALENSVTNLSSSIISGRYFNDPDEKGLVVGSSLLGKYTSVDGVGESALVQPDVGDKVEVTVGNKSHVYPIIGVVKTKVSAVDRRVFIPNNVIKSLVDSDLYKIGEVAIKLEDVEQTEEFLNRIKFVEKYASVETPLQAQPQFLSDIKITFSILGDVIGTIGLIVASITLFIVIFVNAITKRRYIGILKGIGISNLAIEFSYILQAAFYAICGSAIGVAFLYLYIVPASLANPISFPFSDGVISASYYDTAVRTIVLVSSTIIAGYLPARMIVKQNTLDSILGR